MDAKRRRWPNEECGICQKPILDGEPWTEVRFHEKGLYEVHVACMTPQNNRGPIYG